MGTYMWIAIASTSVFAVYVVVLLVLGGSDVDLDLDVNTDSILAFKFFSIHSVLSFLMGVGWFGVALDGYGHVVQFLGSAFVGLLFMLGSAWFLKTVRSLSHIPTYDPAEAVGQVAYVTLRVAPRQIGQIQVVVGGALRTFLAVSEHEIPSHTNARVAGWRDAATAILEPIT